MWKYTKVDSGMVFIFVFVRLRVNPTTIRIYGNIYIDEE